MPLSYRSHVAAYVGGGGGVTFSKSTKGKLLGFLISHAQTTAQRVQFNNFPIGGSGDVLLIVDVAPEQSPYYLMFPPEMALVYDGLSVTTTYCAVTVWTANL
jgi:hypothetical protein